MLILSLFIWSFYAVVLGEYDAEEIEEDIGEDPESLRTLETFWKVGTNILKSHTGQEDFEFKKQMEKFMALKPESPVKLEKSARPVKDIVRMYKQRVLRKGADDIKSIGEYLRKKLYLKKELVSPTVDELTYRFSVKLESSFRFILFKQKYNDFDKQYILLDLVNVARFLLNTVGKALQRKLFAMADEPPYQDNVIITQTILAYNLDFKKYELQFICNKMAVCRPCPAFSDYLASIINEMLKVIDAKFQYVSVKLADLLASKKNLLETFMSRKVLKWFLKRAENVGKESIIDLREVFIGLRSTLSLRHKMLILGDGTMKKEIKSLRILIDIIDNAFERSEHNYLAIQYALTVSDIQEWVKGTRADIDDTLSVFINYLANTLTMALSAGAEKEMKVLSEIIFDGQPVDEGLAEYLLENGSQFVQGLDDEVSNILWDN